MQDAGFMTCMQVLLHAEGRWRMVWQDRADQDLRLRCCGGQLRWVDILCPDVQVLGCDEACCHGEEEQQVQQLGPAHTAQAIGGRRGCLQ
jgi:hypothetical protein